MEWSEYRKTSNRRRRQFSKLQTAYPNRKSHPISTSTWLSNRPALALVGPLKDDGFDLARTIGCPRYRTVVAEVVSRHRRQELLIRFGLHDERKPEELQEYDVTAMRARDRS